jgi:hypothetical protein
LLPPPSASWFTVWTSSSNAMSKSSESTFSLSLLTFIHLLPEYSLLVLECVRLGRKKMYRSGSPPCDSFLYFHDHFLLYIAISISNALKCIGQSCTHQFVSFCFVTFSFCFHSAYQCSYIQIILPCLILFSLMQLCSPTYTLCFILLTVYFKLCFTAAIMHIRQQKNYCIGMCIRKNGI